MIFHLFCILLSLYTSNCLADDSAPSPPSENPRPFGPYYCQARCLASCLETFLAPTLDECAKFCPPFDENLPCPADNAVCWQTCGVPALANDQPAPDLPSFAPFDQNTTSGDEQDPFLINLAWTTVPNASVYIVEFYPLNRRPRSGETNFFRAMTTSLTYTVRKEDECIEYDARVIAVNSYGISIPSYTHLQAPSPKMSAKNHFSVRNMQRDPWSTDMITVTIDYTFPVGWPIDDIDIDTVRVTTTGSCAGSLGQRTFGILPPAGAPGNLSPAFNALIGKTPTTAIQLQFFDDVLQSDCLFRMQISSLQTRCNTTTVYDSDSGHVAGVDFRLNCNTVKGACENDTSTDPLPPPAPLAPIPVPLAVSVDSDDLVSQIDLPGYLPPGVNQPDEKTNTTAVAPETDNMPTPPPLPLWFVGNQQMPQERPMPPSASFSVIDVAPNGSEIQSAIIPQLVVPPLCELEMLDVQPSTSPLSPSVIDLSVTWLERQPLPPPPPPLYFSIRYGPIIRNLVDDGRQQSEIIAGYETIVRTGQQSPDGKMFPDPTRVINIPGVQRSSLLKIQVCAVFDPNSEPMIQWESAPSRRIDLAALEPFLELENTPTDTAIPSPADIQNAVDFALGQASQTMQTDTNNDVEAEAPLILQVGVDSNTSSTMYWITVMAGMMLIIFTALVVFICLTRMCSSRRRMVKVLKNEKPVVVVNTIPPPPMFNEVVKVPLP